ncbi:hypothetical protein ACFQO1_07015 [Jejudonia soesokkakensis]|uniref:Uncharacterized protein n=1 Tax=Jejudonia soesokkakensis TaxID=1323432 RepID=A0ABW2MUR8_9FLAO
MQKKSFLKDLYALIPLFFSGLLCIALIFLLNSKVTVSPDFIETLKGLTTLFIGISGFLATVIVLYLLFSSVNLKANRNAAIDHLSKITQKMHDFRQIVELLYRSKMWLPGLKEYIDDEFEGLTFFDVKEFYKGKSKLAIEFLQENNNYQETENLYLELKSLLMTNPKEKRISENIQYPKVYPQEIVEKWLQHKAGSGLWYFFGYKYGSFKEALKIDSVFERHQDKIMTLANGIDSEAFEDSSFNEVFLSKLGEYMSKEVIPKLFQFQSQTSSMLPPITKFLYGIFLVLVFGGILLPIGTLLFTWPALVLICSFSVVISCTFLIATSLYPFLQKEANS